MGKGRAFVIAALGFEMIFMPVAGFFLGNWLDQRLGSSPWGLLAGLGIGIFGAIRIGIKLYRLSLKEKT